MKMENNEYIEAFLQDHVPSEEAEQYLEEQIADAYLSSTEAHEPQNLL